MRLCFHKWANWSEQYEATQTRDRGRFGDVSIDCVVAQERSCSKCRKVEVRILRDGKLTNYRDAKS